jgi:alanine dehydrogenase
MPGAVRVTSTPATLDHAPHVADACAEPALDADPRRARGLGVARGGIVHDIVAAAVGAAAAAG